MDRSQRRRAGFVTPGRLVFALLLFGAYAGYQYLPVFSAKSQIGRVVDKVLAESPHHTDDEALRHRIVRSASVSSIEIQPREIAISRETRDGEREIRVRVAHPVAIRFLGSERTVGADVEVTVVKPVDEAAEAQRLAKLREDERAWQAELARQEARLETTEQMWAECEAKHGKGNCQWMQVPRQSPGDREFIKAY